MPVYSDTIVPSGQEDEREAEMDTTTDARRPLTPAYVADQLGVSPRTIHRAIADGSIRAIRVGRRWKVPAAELDRLLAGERVAA